MDKKPATARLKKTYSGKGFRAFIILLSVAILGGVAIFIMADFLPDGDIPDGDIKSIILIVILFAILLSFIILFTVAIVLLLKGNKKDIKIYGTGRWSTEFNGIFSPDKKLKAYNFLQEKRFALNVQNGIEYFSRTTNGFVGQYLSIVYSDETVKMEAFLTSTQVWSMGNETGLYGFSAMLMKYNLRKIVAEVLDILEAPQNIEV